ncbi:DUF1178 family protein [Telmatospirillum sp. J64-1]|uniref:DUF1178 family protein n=1 Tax=Telmatospirillum sp. J64-1 TaxID=2502183 RepID=UPI00115D2966|nr:DUF1178 family protein [Telmatospirillum sp. J64-1]
MIKYSLRCSHGHAFESWFDNSADYDAKAAEGALSCPECGDSAISKSIMAPNIGKAAPQPAPACGMGGCGAGACAFANS